MTALIIIGIIYVVFYAWMFFEIKRAPLVPDDLDTDSLPDKGTEKKAESKALFTTPAAAV